MIKKLELSVHELVDFLLRSGDIDNRVFNYNTMQEGTLLHGLYQAKQGKNYLSEYLLKETFIVDDYEIILEGRADGIIVASKSIYIVDEIKTTNANLNTFIEQNREWHLGQAKCYALMLAHQKKLNAVSIRLTYISQNNPREKIKEDYVYFTDQLETDVRHLFEEYLEFYNIINRLREKRNQTIEKMTFPFTNFREGQRKLMKYVYSLQKKGGRLFVEAPTGIGKTMSTLFPLIKTLTDDERGKIFYLTAKSSGKDNAYLAIDLLIQKGLEIGAIVITSKEKICFSKGQSCNPDECPYAKDYYQKVQLAIRYALANFHNFNYDTIVNIAEQFEICPFEFELDLSLFLDIVICDFNYVFDPISYLKRYFDGDSSHYSLLVDEAHNLVDRSRDMYSASLDFKDYQIAFSPLKLLNNKKLTRICHKFRSLFKEFERLLENKENLIIDDLSENQNKIILKFIDDFDNEIKDKDTHIPKGMVDYYFDVVRFTQIVNNSKSEFYLKYLYKNESNNVGIKYACLNPAAYLKEISSKVKSLVYFSGTLSPMEYYLNILGGDNQNDPILKLPSPFPKDNLKIMVAPKISVKYKNRANSYQEVAQYISAFVKQKIGNYLIYFPSYEYQEQILTSLSLPSDIELFSQEREMNHFDQKDFLDHFIKNPTHTTIGTAIIGGSFSEGVDLPDDRLIGVVIVGIGLSRLNFESDQIAEYFKNQKLNGFQYAYVNPGMNKVMQAVGRVIRSENDRGAVLLIDERYLTDQYHSLFRQEWSNYEVVYTPKEVEKSLNKFFNK